MQIGSEVLRAQSHIKNHAVGRSILDDASSTQWRPAIMLIRTLKTFAILHQPGSSDQRGYSPLGRRLIQQPQSIVPRGGFTNGCINPDFGQ